MTDWYYEKDGTAIGPLDIEKLGSLSADGTIVPETLMWSSDFGQEWRKLAEVGELRQIFFRSGSPPPLPTNRITDLWVWLIALSPILYPILGRIAEDNGQNQYLFMFIVVPIVGAFAALDYMAIRKSGRKALDAFLIGILILIPYYLFARGKLLQKSRYLTVVWIITFVVCIAIATPGLLTGNFYWGLGLPSCDARAVSDLSKQVFSDIGINKLRGVTAVAISGQNERYSTDEIRVCDAMIAASDGTTYSAQYTVSLNNNGFVVNLKIGQ